MTPSWGDLRKIAGELLGDAQEIGLRAIAGSGPAPHEILPYNGFGDGSRVLVQGRAVASAEIGPSQKHHGAITNLLNSYKRIDATPLRHARIRVQIDAQRFELDADDEGFFRQWIDLERGIERDSLWHSAEYRLLSPLLPSQPDVRAVGRIMIPSDTATYGVISDLDDTVIKSDVANVVQAARSILLGNAHTRTAFEGVPAFYAALARGGDGIRSNPIFYVSSSPWNLYDVIAEFLALQEIPPGPILLRDWDVDVAALSSARLEAHKAPLIDEIVGLYRRLPFVLIGDTGQRDPEIYRDAVRRHPGRIAAVYIRNVLPKNSERAESMRRVAAEIAAAGAHVFVGDDTGALAADARARGFIL